MKVLRFCFIYPSIMLCEPTWGRRAFESRFAIFCARMTHYIVRLGRPYKATWCVLFIQFLSSSLHMSSSSAGFVFFDIAEQDKSAMLTTI